jgi:hypothetical protein
LLSETVKNTIYTPVIFLVVLLTFETWQRMKGIKNRVLRKIFGFKGGRSKSGWRKLHNKELNNLYLLPNTISGYNQRGLV